MTRMHKTVVIWTEDADELVVIGELTNLDDYEMDGEKVSGFVGPGGAAVRVNTGTLLKALAAMAIRIRECGLPENKDERTH